MPKTKIGVGSDAFGCSKGTRWLRLRQAAQVTLPLADTALEIASL